jgi:hypothetical protein
MSHPANPPAKVVKSAKSGKTVPVADVNQLYLDLQATPPTAVTYIPSFNDGVLIVGPGEPSNLNPDYCLRIPSTFGLMMILKDLQPVMSMADPLNFDAASPFGFTGEAPWLTFANGALRNAGQLAIYWKANNGDPGGKTAENNARLDIAWG